MINSSSKESTLTDRARQLLTRNRRQGIKNGRTFTYTIPSATHYPFQWFWDSCFHAIVLTRLGDIGQAQAELASLMTWQDADGFIPHTIFWDQSKVRRSITFWHWRQSKSWLSAFPFLPKPKHTSEIQPPLLAQAVEIIYQASRDRSWLKRLFPKLLRYYRWLAQHRDPDHDDLLSIISTFESGIDQSPAYDRALGFSDPAPSVTAVFKRSHRLPLVNKLLGYNPPLLTAFAPFLVEDALVNSIYTQGLASLARLAALVGERRTADHLRSKSREVRQTLIARCWDKTTGLFWNLDGRHERRSTVKTIISLMPLILEELPREIVDQVVEQHLMNPAEFALPFPIPTVSRDEASFSLDIEVQFENERPLWRGATWVNTNWFLVHGLRKHGYEKLAETIAEKTRKLVTTHGFREYFNPMTGDPGRLAAEDFGWSTLAIDL